MIMDDAPPGAALTGLKANSVGELALLSESDIRVVLHGRTKPSQDKAVREINEFLGRYGLRLGMSREEINAAILRLVAELMPPPE
jgi:hypothetical protein